MAHKVWVLVSRVGSCTYGRRDKLCTAVVFREMKRPLALR